MSRLERPLGVSVSYEGDASAQQVGHTTRVIIDLGASWTSPETLHSTFHVS